MMETGFAPYPDGKRYYTFDCFFKQKFGCKVAKLSLNGGFTCPNRDGTRGVGGCIYCSDKLSGEFAGDPRTSIASQLAYEKRLVSAKWKSVKYMPYFQAGTGTYAPVERLRVLYEQALLCEDAVALSIATRPDCIEPETYDLLSELAMRTFLTVELGLQSVSDKTGQRIHRQTSFAEFLSCYEELKKRGIAVCVHLINGLPGETCEDMLESVRVVSALHPWSIKLHMLHVLSGTVCAAMYERGEFATFEKDDYVRLICDELEYIAPDIVIQRLTGDGARATLVAPLWSLRKFELLNAIDAEMKKRDSYQGVKCQKE